MKANTKTWLSMLIIVPLIAGVYGISHDQITYSISSEYFTHFKFIQFNIDENLRESERLAAAIVGFLSTWWVGVILAIPLGLIGFRKMDFITYRKSRIQSIKILFLVAIIFGVIGYIVGLIYTSSMTDWPMNVGARPGNVSKLTNSLLQIKYWDNFMVVGTIHNFSYFGVLVGLLVALIQQFRTLKRS